MAFPASRGYVAAASCGVSIAASPALFPVDGSAGVLNAARRAPLLPASYIVEWKYRRPDGYAARVIGIDFIRGPIRAREISTSERGIA